MLQTNYINTYVICLGANVPDAAQRLEDAYGVIAGFGTIVRVSSCYRTEPEYAGETVPYLNRVLAMTSEINLEELQRTLKKYEASIRALNDNCGLVNLDIDIVLHNGAVLRPRDYAATYFRIGAQEIGI